MRTSITTLAVLWVTASGCFRDVEGAPGTPAELQVHDLRGASAASEQAPRDVELALTFVGAAPDQKPVLVRGVLELALAQRLSFSRPGVALAAQLLTLALERDPHALRMRPGSLAPGAYTLVWPYDEVATYPLNVSASPALGARWVESFPGADASQVPGNLSRALLRFDGHVRGDLARALQLRRDGSEIPSLIHVERCSAYGLPEGDCAWITPQAPLVAGAYSLHLGSGLETPGGAALDELDSTFTVGGEDYTPPTLVDTRCALDERALGTACLRSDERTLFVRGGVSEPALVSLVLGGPQPQRAMAISYADSFALSLDHVPARGPITLRLVDLAGNLAELALDYVLADLATLTIDEVRPDPLGKEPAQEYVELLNFGTIPMALTGISLSKDAFERGRTLASAFTLAPGERVLLVGPDFDARDASDGALPAGVRVATLSGALSLANAGGETLFLRDAEGHRLSQARTLTPLLEGQCSHRVGESRDASFMLDPRGGCTPGVGEPVAP